MSAPRRETAHAAWGGSPPDWIVVLADECDRQTIRVVAKRIGMSATTVHEALRKNYKGRLDNVAEKVRGAFMGKTVQCPVLGDELARDRCLEIQGRPFAATNPDRVRFHRTCPTCPNFRGARPDAKPPTSSKPEE